MSNGNGNGAVTWKWIVGVSGGLLVVGMTAFLNFTADRLSTIDQTLMDVRMELVKLRGDMSSMETLRQRVERIDARQQDVLLRLERVAPKP